MSEILQRSGCALIHWGLHILKMYASHAYLSCFFLQNANLPVNWMKMDSQLKFINKTTTNTSNLFYSLSQCRKSSTCLLKSSAKRRCRLCFPSGIRSNREPLMCLWMYSAWACGTKGSFSPWIINVGHLISGSNCWQILPSDFSAKWHIPSTQASQVFAK